MDLRLAAKEMKRSCTSIAKQLHKKLARYHKAEWVLAINYVCESNGMIHTRWNVQGSNPILVHKVEEWKPALENALIMPENAPSCPEKPGNAVKRAHLVRKMLREEWLNHVKGTSYEGKTQCFSLVRQGVVHGFPWWASVVGEGVPFESLSVDRPDVSHRLFDYLSSKRHSFS